MDSGISSLLTRDDLREELHEFVRSLPTPTTPSITRDDLRDELMAVATDIREKILEGVRDELRNLVQLPVAACDRKRRGSNASKLSNASKVSNQSKRDLLLSTRDDRLGRRRSIGHCCSDQKASKQAVPAHPQQEKIPEATRTFDPKTNSGLDQLLVNIFGKVDSTRSVPSHKPTASPEGPGSSGRRGHKESVFRRGHRTLRRTKSCSAVVLLTSTDESVWGKTDSNDTIVTQGSRDRPCKRWRRAQTMPVSSPSYEDEPGSIRTCANVSAQGTECPRRSQTSRLSHHASREMVWTFLEEPESSPMASGYAKLIPALVLLTAFFTLYMSVEPSPIDPLTAGYIEAGIDCFFGAELAVRFIVCPRKQTFFQNSFNFVDLVATAPVVVRALFGFEIPEASHDIWLRFFYLGVVPVIRLCKPLRLFDKFYLLVTAVSIIMEAVPVLILTFLISVIAFSACVYVAEERENVPTLPISMWMTIVTMTTVGYGDYAPQSTAGMIMSSALIICSVLYMAMPLGVFAQAFTQVWENRDRILLTMRCQEKLSAWGYTANDIPSFFQKYDGNETGELSINEFRDMMEEMNINLTPQRIIQLFEILDKDGGGTVDDREFVRSIFPEKYHEVYAGRPEARADDAADFSD